MQLALSMLGFGEKFAEKKPLVLDILNSSNMYLHLDILRQDFVKRDMLSLEEIAEVSTWHSRLFVHIMSRQLDDILACLNSSIKGPAREDTYVAIPIEAYADGGFVSYGGIYKPLQMLRQWGFKPGVSLEPDTIIAHIDSIYHNIDMVLLMTVNSGKGGQEFNQYPLTKADKAKYYGKTVAIDGGVNEESMQYLRPYSEIIDIAVVGSYITSAADPVRAVKSLLA